MFHQSLLDAGKNAWESVSETASNIGEGISSGVESATNLLESGTDYIGDKFGEAKDFVSDKLFGDDDGDVDENTTNILKNKNNTSLLTNDNGELNNKGLVDGNSEINNSTLNEDKIEKITPVKTEQQLDIKVDPSGVVVDKPFNPLGEYDNRKLNPNYKPSIEEAVGSGSLMNVALEPGASGGLYEEKFDGPWSPEVYDQRKRDAGFDDEGNQSVDKVKQNVSAKEEEIAKAKNEEDKRKSAMKGKMKEFGAKISEMGADMAKNPYEYKPW